MLRVKVLPVQPAAWAAVKHALAPQGPLVPVISAAVSRLSLVSVPATSRNL